MAVPAGRWIRLAATVGLLAVGCGSGSATGVATSPSPTSAASATPVPAASLALVNLRGGDHIVVRDVTDISHPTTVAALAKSPPQPRFISATELVFLDPDVIGDFATYPSNVMRAPLSGSPTTLVASAPHGIFLFALAPDGRTAAYVTTTSDRSELHLVSGGNDRLVSSMPPIFGGCESPSCVFHTEFRLLYSPDGKYISLTQSYGGPNFRLWDAQGKLLKSNPDGSSYSGSVWSGGSLYFVDADGVEFWRNGVTSAFLPGVRWVRPHGSPDGSHIVYAASDKAGSTHVYVVDIGTRSIREIKQSRRDPVFLTSRYLWYQGERACQTVDLCDNSLPVIASGTTYIYDLVDGTEATSLITDVHDVWPHAA